MADVKRQVRQWLETDAAFGVVEVPIPRRKRAKDAGGTAAAAPVAKVTPARPVAPVPSVARPVQPAVPVRPAATRVTSAAEKDVPKKIVAMPLIPAGLIAELPAISRAEKEKLLAALLDRTNRDSAAYINDVSTKLVFGEGDIDAHIMFIGEGPGIEEDRTGRPFVGRSGQLLDKMITAMGLSREGSGGGAYIANVVKLRAAEWDDASGRLKDRPPTPEEAARAMPVLHEQIEIIRPKAIVTLGAPAIKYLTGTTEGVTKIRGTWLSFRGIPVMPTYHPSFLLRAYTPENRKKVWGDLQMAMKKIGR